MLTRDGILRERFADTLTDALRATLLRREGYRVDVVEFVESAHTPRNTLIRAVRTRGRASERRDLRAQARSTPTCWRRGAYARAWASCSTMRDLRRAALGLVVAAPFLLGAAAGGDEEAETAFRFDDPDIVESSGLAVVGPLVVTTNDSGDSGRVFTVDPASGQTVGVTSWPGEPVDVEALAPAGDGHVWVADIGDNRHVRDSVEVLRVPVGRGDRDAEPASYELVYPDGAHDAEALLAHPVTGRLFVVTKGVFAATVYAAPARLRPDRPNRLAPVAQAPGLVTDASFLPGRWRRGPADLLPRLRRRLPVVAAGDLVGAARAGPGRGGRRGRGRPAAQHRGRALHGPAGAAAGTRRAPPTCSAAPPGRSCACCPGP